MTALRYTGKTLLWILTISVALVSWRFFVGGVAETMNIVAHNIPDREIALFAHIGFAPLALLLMPFQFWKGLRMRRPKIHRWIGRIYVLAILISGVGGLFIAFYTTAGTFAAIGFGLLAVLWIATTLIGLWHIRARRIVDHQRWMIRSAALTFAAVTLRLWLPLGTFGMGFPFDTFYPYVAWLCWVPNLIIAEVWLRKLERAKRFELSTFTLAR